MTGRADDYLLGGSFMGKRSVVVVAVRAGVWAKSGASASSSVCAGSANVSKGCVVKNCM